MEAKQKAGQIPAMEMRVEVQELQAKVSELQQQKSVVDEEINAIVSATEKKQILIDQARELIESGTLPEARALPSREKLDELYAHRRVIIRAVEMAREDLVRVRDRISREICESPEVRGQNCALAASLRDAIELVVQRALAYRKFRDDLQDKGIQSGRLADGSFPFLGYDLNSGSGIAANWIQDCRRAGLIR